jgi:hypothetical protein
VSKTPFLGAFCWSMAIGACASPGVSVLPRPNVAIASTPLPLSLRRATTAESNSTAQHGNVEDWLAARLAHAATWFALDASGICASLHFQPDSDDGGSGSVRLGSARFEYWLGAGWFTLASGSRPLSSKPLTGETDVSILLGESELFFTERDCRAHARRSPPLLLGPGRAAADDDRFLSSFRPAEAQRLSTASGQAVSVVHEPGVGPLRLSIDLPDGALTVFAYPAHGVAWVQASTPTALPRGLYPLRLGAASLAIGPLRLWFAPATHDVSANGVDPSPAIYEATDEVRDGYEPMRAYLAAGATLFWPVLTAHGVSCVPHELRGASGSVVLESGQDRHEHRYTQNELGIELDPVPCVSYYPPGGGPQHTYCPAPARRQLAVHGRDDVSFFVDGSRWFFDTASCEAAKSRVRPLELAFVRSITSHLAAARVQPLRSPLAAVAWPPLMYRAESGAPGCTELGLVPRPTLPVHGAQRGLLTLANGESYDYEVFPDPLAIWLSRRGKGRERMNGELRLVQPPKSAADGLRVGDELWFSDLRACNAALHER